MHFSLAKRLPTFLRPFCPGGKLTRLLYTSVELFERTRLYERAVTRLRQLLAQSAIYATSRGRWWDRLALDLDRHLRRPAAAVEAIQEALADPHVVGGFRLALLTRGERLATSATKVGVDVAVHKAEAIFCSFCFLSVQPDAAERVLPSWPILEAPAVTIEGRLVSGPAPMWLSPDGGLLCGVEQFAIQHYRAQVFSRFFLLHVFKKNSSSFVLEPC